MASANNDDIEGPVEYGKKKLDTGNFFWLRTRWLAGLILPSSGWSNAHLASDSTVAKVLVLMMPVLQNW